MKKSILTIVSLLLASTMIFAYATTVAAEDEPKYYICGNYIYEYINESAVQILYYVGDESTINIPEKIEGAKVQSIAPLAFYGVSAREINIPDTVVEIGDEAFFSSKVKNVTMPKNSYKIGIGVFRDCVKLESVTFEDDYSHSELGKYMFYGCTNLKEINLPDKIIEIPTGAFSYCKSLEHINFSPKLKYIDSNAFYASGLRAVSFGDYLMEIGSKAFAYCPNLETITPKVNYLSYVADDAFLECKAEFIYETIPTPPGPGVSGYYPDVITPEGNAYPGNPSFPQEEYLPGYNYSYNEGVGDVPEREGDVIDLASDKVFSDRQELVALAYNVLPIGDADLDNIVTIKDVTVIQKFAANLIDKNRPGYDQMFKNADLDGDGEITVLHATKVQKYLANIINSLY